MVSSGHRAVTVTPASEEEIVEALRADGMKDLDHTRGHAGLRLRELVRELERSVEHGRRDHER